MKSPPVSTIFFDLDDTLVDNVHAQRAALRETYERYRAVFHTIACADFERTFEAVTWELWALLGAGRLTEREYYSQRFLVTMNRLVGAASYMKYDLRDAFDLEPFFEECYRRHTRALDGAGELLRELRKTYTLGILANGFAGVQHLKVACMGWTELFAHFVTFEDAGAMRPAVPIFDAARACAGVGADALAFVGDHYENDVAGAKAAGWWTVWYNPRGTPAPANHADAVVHTLRDVAALFQRTP